LELKFPSVRGKKIFADFEGGGGEYPYLPLNIHEGYSGKKDGPSRKQDGAWCKKDEVSREQDGHSPYRTGSRENRMGIGAYRTGLPLHRTGLPGKVPVSLIYFTDLWKQFMAIFV
jgi:hypothetical protein